MLISNIKLQAEGHKRTYNRYTMALIRLDNEQKIVYNAYKTCHKQSIKKMNLKIL